MRKPLIIGQRFGQLKVVRNLEMVDKFRQTYVLCKCDCGVEKAIRRAHIAHRKVVSCGCHQKIAGRANRKHGMTKSGEYHGWLGMKARCYNVDHPKYESYGARGIYVCDRWRDSFEDFYADMGARPSPTYSVDRKDNDGPYSPDNCHWATKSEQAKNRRYHGFHLRFRKGEPCSKTSTSTRKSS